MNDYFKDGTANVGGKDVVFERRQVRGGFLIYVPRSFLEDKSIVSNYSYLFSKDKSPLSIAVRFAPITAIADRQKMIDNYFNQSQEAKLSDTESHDGGIHFRETVTSSQYMSVYSFRFSVDVEGGLLFGCFNCSAKYKDDWKPVVLEILKNIEKE